MSDMFSIPEFSDQAYIYAVYRTHIDFGIYTGEINNTELLELHIFDCTKEFRAIYSTARKTYIISERIGDITTRFIDDKMMLYGTEMKRDDDKHVMVTENGRVQTFRLPERIKKLVFGDPSKTLLEPFMNDDCLYVRNYYDYDKNNLLYLKGYRLLGITKGGAWLG